MVTWEQKFILEESMLSFLYLICNNNAIENSEVKAGAM